MCLANAPFLLAMVGIFYFLLIRPQQQQDKRHKELMSALRTGEKVVMNSGLHGVVDRLDENTVTIRVDDTRMTFDRSAVGRVIRDESPAESS